MIDSLIVYNSLGMRLGRVALGRVFGATHLTKVYQFYQVPLLYKTLDI